MKSTRQSKAAGFTLIELLAAMLLPVLSQAKQRAHQAICINNLKQMYLLYVEYADISEDYFPPSYSAHGGSQVHWYDCLNLATLRLNAYRDPYNNDLMARFSKGHAPTIFHCPSRPPDDIDPWRDTSGSDFAQNQNIGINREVYGASRQPRDISKFSNLINSERVALLADVGDEYSFYNTPVRLGIRHVGNRRINFLYCDNHVEDHDVGILSVPPEEWLYEE